MEPLLGVPHHLLHDGRLDAQALSDNAPRLVEDRPLVVALLCRGPRPSCVRLVEVARHRPRNPHVLCDCCELLPAVQDVAPELRVIPAKGWFTDATYSNNAIKSGADQNLGITIKGTTVSVKWNNTLVISYAFNALATDGATGLFSRSGTTSFDVVKFQTDDPRINATGSSGGTSGGTSVVLTAERMEAMAVSSLAYSTDLRVKELPSSVSAAIALPPQSVQQTQSGAIMGSIAHNILGGGAAGQFNSAFGYSSTTVGSWIQASTVGSSLGLAIDPIVSSQMSLEAETSALDRATLHDRVRASLGGGDESRGSTEDANSSAAHSQSQPVADEAPVGEASDAEGQKEVVNEVMEAAPPAPLNEGRNLPDGIRSESDRSKPDDESPTDA